jgi:hypothetical protein
VKKTVEQLKQIIKEELTRILAEDQPQDRPALNFSELAAEYDEPLEEEEDLYYEGL